MTETVHDGPPPDSVKLPTSKQPWDGYRFSVDTVGESVRQFMLTLWNTYAFYGQYATLPQSGAEPELTPTEARLFTTAAAADSWLIVVVIV